MINTAATFIHSVLTSYNFYRYITQNNHLFKTLLFETLKWEFFYLLSTLILIYTCDRVCSEVNSF